jgi:hypothetical protein
MMRWMQKAGKRSLVLIILLMVVACTIATGCMSRVQHATSESAPPINGEPKTSLSPTINPDPTPVPTVFPQTTIASPVKTEVAQEVPPPFTVVDPYPMQHATRIDSVPMNLSSNRIPDYTKKYTLQSNTFWLLINVEKGPLWINFDVTPVKDCMSNHCREPGSRPTLVITVVDKATEAIVAQDGYGTVYSWQKTGRSIVIYREGQYYLNITGNDLDATLSVATGASPFSAPPATPTPGEYDESYE